ncbi:MAG: phosphoglycolate phosphatase [Candidatus Marinimicrobia bacterium]|nr:phosphoglycolate phosphatase [Candidatus Neomarinimicrobiota bacterium]
MIEPLIISYDLDGTLVDSIPDITLSMNKTLDEAGLPHVTAGQMKAFVGNGIPPMVERALKAVLAQVKTEKEFKTLYTTILDRYKIYYEAHCTDETRLYTGVREILDHFSGKTQVLITNKAESMTRKILKYFGLEDYFAIIVGGDTLAEKKPHPDVIHHIWDKTGQEGLICHVGDSPIDIKMAKDTGQIAVAATWGYSSRQELTGAGPDYLVDHLNELKEIIA